MAMAAATSSLLLFHKPTTTCNFYFQHSSAPAYISSARFRRCSSNIPLNRRSLCSFSAPNTVAYLVRTHALRDGGQERFQALEQDAFVNNPSNDLVSHAGINVVANRLSKWVVAALFVTILLLRHDGASLWAVIGFISNSLLSVTLKRILNQERPVATLRSDPGMPSSHAQSISFISLFTLFSVMEWLGTNPLSLFLCGLILAFASYFIWLRVSQKLHTTSQVVVGAIVGSVYSTLWYITWNSLLSQAFASSFPVQMAVFTVAAASSLGSAVYVILSGSKKTDDKKHKVKML